MKKDVYALIVVLLGVAILLTVCLQHGETASSPTPALTPRYGGILRMLYQNAPTNIGYPPTMDGTSGLSVNWVALQCFLKIDSRSQFLPTGLTTAYTVASNGLSYTFTLRKGVKFHDGTEYNAPAAKWNLERAIEGKTYGTLTWKSVDVIDNYTLRLNLKQRDYTVIGNLGRNLYVISPTAFEKNGMDWTMTHPVGTGPFKLKSFERNVATTYERFNDYWDKGLPYLDGVRYDYRPDQTLAAMALQAGETDVLWWISAINAAQLRDKGFAIIAPYKQWMNMLVPDSMNPKSVLANPKVIQALEYATNKEAIAKALGYGFWAAMNQAVDPHYVAGYIPHFEGRKYDPQKAKQLLAEAGYTNGFTTSIIDVAENPTMKDAGEAIQKNWADVGVTLKINLVPNVTHVNFKNNGWTDGFLVVATGCDENYTNTLTRVFSTDQKTYTSTKRPDGWPQAIQSALESPDFATYQKRTQAAVKMLFDQATAIPLWGYATAQVTTKTVHDTGFYSVNFSYWSPEKTWLSK